MDFILEYIDVIITALVTGIGGYALSTITHKRNKKLAKADHLRELYDEFARGLNLLFDVAEDLIDFAQGIYLVGYTPELEEEIDKELEKAIEADEKYTSILNNVNIKFDFEKTLAFEQEMEEYISKLHDFIDFIEKVEPKKGFLINKEELEYIESVENYLKNRTDIIYRKMQYFYSSQYLPKPNFKKLKS